MQNFKILTALCILLVIQSCSTDFELNADWKEVTAMYSILDQSQERQYVRLTKAYLGEGSALEMAQEADSLYFQNATVQLRGYSGSNLVETIDLTKVDAANVSVDFHPEKEEGVFVHNPYFVYHTDASLDASYTYEVAVNTDKDNEVTAKTSLVSDFDLITPTNNDDINWLSTNKQIKWKKASNAGIYGLDIILTYREYANNETDESQYETKQVVYPIFSNLKDEDELSPIMEFDFDPNLFFSYIAQSIGEEGAENYKRIFRRLEYTYYAGNDDFTRYFDVATANRTGLGNSGQAQPIYNNIESGEGVGLVAARFSKTIEVNVPPSSLDELICGDFTKNLRFVRFIDQAINCP